MIRPSINTLMFATTLAALAGVAIPAGAVSLEAVEKASTPADHEALAAEYDQQAVDARKEAEKHRSMAAAYASGVKYGKVGHSGKGSMKLHCERLAEHYESLAKDAESLAALHRQLATQK